MTRYVLWAMALYYGALLYMSQRFSTKIDGLMAFFMASRRFGVWPMALTFVASWFGAGSTLGSLNAYAASGLAGAWMIAIPSILSCMVISSLMSYRVARYTGLNQQLSQPEAAAQTYGASVQTLLAVVILVCSVTTMASQLVALWEIFQAILGTWASPELLTVIITAIVIGYSLFGGYVSVVLTDVGQFFGFSLALIVLLLWLWFQPNQLPLASIQQHMQLNTFWHNWPSNLAYTLTFVIAWSIAPEMWQRMSACQSPKKAFQSALLATIILGVLLGLVLIIGLLGDSLDKPHHHASLVLVAHVQHMPHWLGALVLVGVMSAITSTIDSGLNVASLTATRNLLGPVLEKQVLRQPLTQQQWLSVSRWMTLLLPLPALLIALAYRDIIKILWLSADCYASAMAVPVWGMLFVKQPRPQAGLWAMVAGGSVVVVTRVASVINPAWDCGPWATMYGIGASTLGFLLGQIKPR